MRIQGVHGVRGLAAGRTNRFLGEHLLLKSCRTFLSPKAVFKTALGDKKVQHLLLTIYVYTKATSYMFSTASRSEAPRGLSRLLPGLFQDSCKLLPRFFQASSKSFRRSSKILPRILEIGSRGRIRAVRAPGGPEKPERLPKAPEKPRKIEGLRKVQGCNSRVFC